MIETRTGDVLRLSASGSVIDTVKTDPRLVPNHSVGISVDGSAETFIQIKKMKRQSKGFEKTNCLSTYRFSSYNYPRRLSTSPLQTLCFPDSTSTMSATGKMNCPIYLHDRYLQNENKELQLNNVICVRRRFMSFMLCWGLILIFTLHVQSV